MGALRKFLAPVEDDEITFSVQVPSGLPGFTRTGRLVDVTITKSGRVLIRGTYEQRLLVIGQIERTTVKWSSLWKTDEGPELSPLALEMIAGRVADVMTLFRTCRFDPKWLDDHTLCLKGG